MAIWAHLSATDVRELPVSYELPDYTVEQIMAASDEDVLRMAKEQGIDPAANAEHCQALFEESALGRCRRCGELVADQDKGNEGCEDPHCPATIRAHLGGRARKEG